MQLHYDQLLTGFWIDDIFNTGLSSWVYLRDVWHWNLTGDYILKWNVCNHLSNLMLWLPLWHLVVPAMAALWWLKLLSLMVKWSIKAPTSPRHHPTHPTPQFKKDRPDQATFQCDLCYVFLHSNSQKTTYQYHLPIENVHGDRYIQ